MSKPDGGPAMPRTVFAGSPHELQGEAFNNGMSLRDYLAAAALMGMLANPKWPNVGSSGLPASEENCAAHWAYGFSDAMLRERDK